jgi:hypothetical protein
MKFGIGGNREIVTLWQVAIPIDRDREEFIQQCITTNTLSLIGREGGMVHLIPCPDSVLQQVDFPERGELGSQVICGNIQVDNHEQLIVLNSLRTRDKMLNNTEGTYRFQKVSKKGEAEVTIKGDRGEIYLSVSSTEEDGGNIVIDISNEQNAGSLTINVNGSAEINATNYATTVSESIKEQVTIPNEEVNPDGYKTTFTKTLTGFQVDVEKEADGLISTLKYEMGVGFSYLDEFGNNIEINEEVISIISAAEVVNLGSGTEAMILGDTLAQLLKDLIKEISIATTPSGPLGNAALIANYIGKVDTILSKYSNTD